MIAIIPALYIVLLLGSILFGLLLLGTGIVLLIKLKNKLAGGLTTAVGVVFTLMPLLILMALTVTSRVQF